MFQRIVYTSRAAPGIGLRDAYDIIRVSHNRNSLLGLTGALLFLDGHFIQVLEGDRLRLQDRYRTIAANPRHTAVQTRQCVDTTTLLIPDEWMALRHAAEVGADLKAAFGYQPGLPASQFSDERILAFVQACVGRQLASRAI